MGTQKFQKGNLVKVLIGHPITCFVEGKEEVEDISPESVGKLAIINYSYAEKYGGRNTDDYSIIYLDTGFSEAWKSENQLEFVNEGGEHLFIEAQKNGERIFKRKTDLKYILENWDDIVINGCSSITIKYLFDKVGIKSSFERNGEYAVLYHDWEQLLPSFHTIFNAESEENLLSKLNSKLDPAIKNKVMNLYNQVQQIKG